jgi:hypothetical protein
MAAMPNGRWICRLIYDPSERQINEDEAISRKPSLRLVNRRRRASGPRRKSGRAWLCIDRIERRGGPRPGHTMKRHHQPTPHAWAIIRGESEYIRWCRWFGHIRHRHQHGSG